jgi:hypothetical protein
MSKFKGTTFDSWFNLGADKIIFMLKEIKDNKDDFISCPFTGK